MINQLQNLTTGFLNLIYCVILLILTRKLLMNLLSLVSSLFTKPTLKVISADRELPVTTDVSVKAITIPGVGKHFYADFILGNHNWKQKCIVNPD